MRPDNLKKLIQSGSTERYVEGQTFYALDFKEALYVVKTGFVKRYSVTKEGNRVIESIYGPGYFFPLTPIYNLLYNFRLSQDNNTYVYQAMTNVETQGISGDVLTSALEANTELYSDLFYEAGVRLKANINRLASNAIKDSYKKLTHQLVFLADEFGEVVNKGVSTGIKLGVPLKPIDMAEQLNMPLEAAEAAMRQLAELGLIKIKDSSIIIPDLDLLADVYL